MEKALPDTRLHDDIYNICTLVDKIIAASDLGVPKLNPELLQSAKNFCSALRNSSSLKIQVPAGSSRRNAAVFQRGYQDNTCSLPPLPPIADSQLERAVFTHPGLSQDPGTTYDRLEVLGDAYLELFSTKIIWDKFHKMPSGRISQIRELLVKNETLAEYATRYGLDKKASVPIHYTKQARTWIKTKGDIFEAYVAAVVLSNHDGYAVAETWLSQLWSPKLEDVEESRSFLQAKEALARRISGKGVKLNYIDEKRSIEHGRGTQTYYIGVYLTGWGWRDKHLGSGQGSNKTIAGNKAAQQALGNGELIQEIVAAKISQGATKLEGRPPGGH